MLSRVISASLSPNAEFSDVMVALRSLSTPWRWQQGNHIYKVEKWFCGYFNVPCSVTFNSGRSALLAILKAFGIGIGDEILVQAFTCVAVPNSVLWAGARPVYVDIDESLNISALDIEKKITPQTRAIVVQHTLGNPADMDKIVAIAKKNKLFLIEDCAHSLGATYKGKKIGSFGDAAFFSFGRDKVISSVFGGAAIIGPQHAQAVTRLLAYHKNLPYPRQFWIFQQIIHPIAFACIIPLYTLGIGKLLLVSLQKLRLLSFPVYPQEKIGAQPTDFPARYADGLALLLLTQLRKLDRFNDNRRNIAKLYREKLVNNKECTLIPDKEGAIYLRFPMLCKGRDIRITQAKKKGILLGNWYHHVIDPKGTDFAAIGYQFGSCRNAERVSTKIINLPTRISSKEANKVGEVFLT